MNLPLVHLNDLGSRRFFGRGLREGFTLIELLVVISIIAVLAGLSVGLVGVASRKNKEARLKAELSKYVTAIDNYKAALGAFPPDNPGRPSTNQLFYELSGTIFGNGTFTVPSRQESISVVNVKAIFGRSGIANSARDEKDLKFTEGFKAAQYKEISLPSPNVDVELLAVPVRGPTEFRYRGGTSPLAIKSRDGTTFNPWLYDSSSTNRNNANGFDLWTEVVIGKKIIRFSNWEREPVTIGQTP